METEIKRIETLEEVKAYISKLKYAINNGAKIELKDSSDSEKTTGKLSTGDKVKITVGNETVTLYAVWEANTYTVIYSINGGTSGTMANTTCTYDQNCTLRSNAFSKTGYTYQGWATSTSGGVAYTNGEVIKNEKTRFNIYFSNTYCCRSIYFCRTY